MSLKQNIVKGVSIVTWGPPLKSPRTSCTLSSKKRRYWSGSFEKNGSSNWVHTPVCFKQTTSIFSLLSREGVRRCRRLQRRPPSNFRDSFHIVLFKWPFLLNQKLKWSQKSADETLRNNFSGPKRWTISSQIPVKIGKIAQRV